MTIGCVAAWRIGSVSSSPARSDPSSRTQSVRLVEGYLPEPRSGTLESEYITPTMQVSADGRWVATERLRQVPLDTRAPAVVKGEFESSSSVRLVDGRIMDKVDR